MRRQLLERGVDISSLQERALRSCGRLGLALGWRHEKRYRFLPVACDDLLTDVVLSNFVLRVAHTLEAKVVDEAALGDRLEAFYQDGLRVV